MPDQPNTDNNTQSQGAVPSTDSQVVPPPPNQTTTQSTTVGTENVEVPPPPIVTSGNGSGTTQAPPPVDDNAPPLDIPPVVTTDTTGGDDKKKKNKKIIATVLGIFLLVGGIGAGVFLVQQQQDIREKAQTGFSCSSFEGMYIEGAGSDQEGECDSLEDWNSYADVCVSNYLGVTLHMNVPGATQVEIKETNQEDPYCGDSSFDWSGATTHNYSSTLDWSLQGQSSYTDYYRKVCGKFTDASGNTAICGGAIRLRQDLCSNLSLSHPHGITQGPEGWNVAILPEGEAIDATAISLSSDTDHFWLSFWTRDANGNITPVQDSDNPKGRFEYDYINQTDNLSDTWVRTIFYSDIMDKLAIQYPEPDDRPTYLQVNSYYSFTDHPGTWSRPAVPCAKQFVMDPEDAPPPPTPNPSPAPTPSPPPPPPPPGEEICYDIKAYYLAGSVESDEDNWISLTQSELANLSPGDTVYFTVSGSGNVDDARFGYSYSGCIACEDIWHVAIDTKPGSYDPVEYYDKFVIPSSAEGETTFTVSAQLHYVGDESWF